MKKVASPRSDSSPYYGLESTGIATTTFVGRNDELHRLHDLLQQSEQVAITAATGMSGLGKTELARQYLLRHRDDYAGGIWWLAGREVARQIVFNAQRMELPPAPDTFETEAQIVAWYWDKWLQRFPQGRRLLVIDDIERYDALKPLLPTEAQWEYACRAGSEGDYCFGDGDGRLGDYAWYNGNSGSPTHPVGQKQPNAWGIYDMHGNVWEWCADHWHDNYSGAPNNAETIWSTSEKNSNHLLRGGAWYYDSFNCRSAYRNHNVPGYCVNYIGFRVVALVQGLP